MIYIVQSLSIEEKEEFVAFFQDKNINFAWTYSYIPCLDPDLVMHHLSITLGVKPIKQKLKKMHPHVALLFKVELENLLKDSFIHAINYVEWISNIVLVSKHDKSIQVCTNF